MTTFVLTAVTNQDGWACGMGTMAEGGSVAPAELYDSQIGALVSVTPGGAEDTIFLVRSIVAQNFFTSITDGSVTLLSAAADFSTNEGGPYSQWEWAGTALVTDPGVQTVVIDTPDAPPDGTIKSVSGYGTITKSDGTVITLGQGGGIVAGDTITTSSDCYVQLTMVDGWSTTIQSDSKIVVEKYAFSLAPSEDDGIVLSLLKGAARFVTGALQTGILIVTPFGTFGVRGTDWTLQVGPNGTTVTVRSGTVVASNAYGTLTLTAGQTGFVPLIGAPYMLQDQIAPKLRPGKYQVAVTYLRADGQESGARRALEVELFQTGGISLSAIPVSADPGVTHKVIYATTCGGKTLYRVGVIPNTQTTFLIDTVRAGASPLLTQFLSPPPPGDFLGAFKGWLLVASGNRIYPSEWYAPELFDLRKSLPMRDRITMIAPVHEGVWVGTDTQILWLQGDSPETWTFTQKADYGVIPGALCFVEGETFGDGQAAGMKIALFASKTGLCAGHAGGQLTTITAGRYAYPVQERGAAIVRRHRGMIQFLATLQGTEVPGNAAN